MTSDGRDPRTIVARIVSVGMIASCLGLVATSLAGRWSGANLVWSLWSDRDMVRAARLHVAPQYLGAELSYGEGARVPGGLLYQLLSLPIAIDPSPLTAFRFQTLLDALGMLVLGAAAWRTWSLRAALLAVGLYAASPVVVRNLAELWNPGMLPLFVAVGWAAALEGERAGDARWLGLSILAFALGAQLHLSALLPAIGVVTWFVACRRPHLLTGLGLASLAVAVAYAHAVWSDAASGWENARALVAPGQAALLRAHPPSALEAATNAVGLWAVTEGQPLSMALRAQPTWTIATNTPLALALLAPFAVWLPVIGGRSDAPGRRDPAWLLLVGIGASTLWFALESNVDLLRASAGKGRYLQALVPAYAVLVGAAIDGLARRLPWAGRELAWVVVAMGVQLQAGGLRRAAEPVPGDLGLLATQETLLAALRRELGGSLTDVAGRTVIVQRADDFPTIALPMPVDYALLRAGEVPPGSLPPPCAAVLPAGATVDDLRATLPVEVVVVREAALPDGFRLVVYLPGADRLCPTDLSNRYVVRDEEAWVRVLLRPGAGPGPVAVDVPGRTAEVVRVRLADGRIPDLLLATEVVRDATGLRLVLHSNELRGLAYNVGLFGRLGLGGLEVVLRPVDGGDDVVLPLGATRFGMEGAIGPVVVDLAGVPPGAWEVRLRGEGFRSEEFRLADDPGAPFDAVILGALRTGT